MIVRMIIMKTDNTVVDIDSENFFSFAFGTEIALVYNRNFYILDCDEKLWLEVLAKVKQTRNLNKLKDWWYSQSKSYEMSSWSNDFNELIKEK